MLCTWIMALKVTSQTPWALHACGNLKNILVTKNLVLIVSILESITFSIYLNIWIRTSIFVTVNIRACSWTSFLFIYRVFKLPKIFLRAGRDTHIYLCLHYSGSDFFFNSFQKKQCVVHCVREQSVFLDEKHHIHVWGYHFLLSLNRFCSSGWVEWSIWLFFNEQCRALNKQYRLHKCWSLFPMTFESLHLTCLSLPVAS